MHCTALTLTNNDSVPSQKTPFRTLVMFISFSTELIPVCDTGNVSRILLLCFYFASFFSACTVGGFAFGKLSHRSKEIETQKSQSDSERIIPTYACFFHCMCSYLGSKGKASINNRIRSFVSLAAIPRQHTCFSNDGEFCCCFSSECSFPKCSHECGYKRDILLPVCSEPRECVCINATLNQSGDWM